MIHLDLSKLFRTNERRLASDVTLAAEGKAAVAVYEDGEMRVKPSTGAAGEKFAGILFSCRTPLETVPAVSSLKASGTSLTLPHTPIPGSLRIQGLTEGAPATKAGEYSVNGQAVTLNAAQAGGTFTVQYTYSPSVLEAQRLQGDVEPGAAVSSALRVSGVVEGGEVFTSEFDTAADWSNPTSVRLGADGKFTTSGTGVVVPCLVTRLPSAGNAMLGLSFNI